MNSTPPFWDLSRESWDARSEPLPKNKNKKQVHVGAPEVWAGGESGTLVEGGPRGRQPCVGADGIARARGGS